MNRKISVLGLDAAGKTSIITAITKRFGFEEDVENLMPTRRISRDTFRFLGVEFYRMDFGGQEQYRIDYLKSPGKYLGGTDLIFFVMDAQDTSRYVEALDYLDELLLYFKEVQNYVPLAILFHKYDPDLENKAEIDKQIILLKQSLAKYSRDFDLYFFETSIFDIKSIMDAFSSALSLLFENIELVSHLLQELSKNYNSLFVGLFDSRGITVGEYFKPHLHINEKMKILEVYMKAQQRIIQENKKLYEFSDKFAGGRRFSGVLETLTFGNLNFYLLFIVEEDEKELEKTINLLDKIEAARPQMENLLLQIIQ